jgi:hypothetical protein
VRTGDFVWLLALALLVALLAFPPTHRAFVGATAAHPFLVGFAKFLVLATMGELLALRIVRGRWSAPAGLGWRAVTWGLIGMAIVLVFDVFASGVAAAMSTSLLPCGDSRLAFAFFVSVTMNATFAPAMMLFHRATDAFIDLRYKQRQPRRPGIAEVVAAIDWQGFVSFVLLKTIPFFWIPAHTVTFLLPPEYRVLAAAMLSIALGAILAFARRRPAPAAGPGSPATP